MNLIQITKQAKKYEYFVNNIIIDKITGCWLYQKGIGTRGYATLRIEGKSYRAHRYSYLMHKGNIPEGLVIDHLCRKTNCCNPDHLEAVTQRTNIERGHAWHRDKWRPKAYEERVGFMRQVQEKRIKIQLEKTHCKYGHEYTSENTRYYAKTNRKNISRTCLQCRRIAAQKRNFYTKAIKDSGVSLV